MTKVAWVGETLVLEFDGQKLSIPSTKVGVFLDALLDEVCIDCGGPLHDSTAPKSSN